MNCLIIAGAPEYDIDLIKEQSQKSDLIICADKGYTYAKIAGVKPDIVIGDFDSCTDEVSGDFETVKLNTDKDFTDTHICVTRSPAGNTAAIFMTFRTLPTRPVP